MNEAIQSEETARILQNQRTILEQNAKILAFQETFTKENGSTANAKSVVPAIVKHHLRTFFAEISKVIEPKCLTVNPKVSGPNLSADESSNGENYGVVDMHPDGNAPYQDEPLAIVGQDYNFRFEEDRDGISPETLEARFTKIYV
ncbi:Hypothetical predicted protein, partial [Paramuricea clavata]